MRRGEDDWDQFVLWTEGGRARLWWSARSDMDQPDSLCLALAGAAGVSGRLSNRVPPMLMPELQNPPRSSLQSSPARLVQVPDAEAAGCVVLERELAPGGLEQTWIDRSTHLIRRVVEPRHPLGSWSKDAIEKVKAENPEIAARITKRLESQAWRTPVDVEQITDYEAAVNVAVDPAELVFAPPT